MIRHLDIELNDRIETGGFQIGDDWPGLFIRGDDCFQITLAIEAVEKHISYSTFDSFFLQVLSGLKEMIKANVILGSKL